MTLTKIASTGVEDSLRWVLGANGNSDYTFTGPGLTGTVNDPTIYLTRGHTYIFQNNSGGHPFYIKTSIANGGTNDAYNTGVTNNGGGNGTEIVFTVPHDSPDILYYQCSSHASMAGQFNIAGSVADGSISTAKIADDAVTDAKLANSINAAIAANTAKTSNATHTGDVTGSTALTIADDAVTTAKIASGAITGTELAGNIAANKLEVNDAHIIIGDASNDGSLQTLSGDVTMTRTGAVTIADQAVTLAKLEHGTSSNDGKFLRANNGADPSFETVTSTTINNNADNRVITGSDTANTLNAESNVVIDSSGNVGIGTTSLSDKLTIGDGDLKFYNSNEANNHRTTFIEFQNSANRITSESNFGSGSSSAYAAGYKFTTKNFNGSSFETLTPFVIQANGKVGIGMTNPDDTLDVNGTFQVSSNAYVSGTLYALGNDLRIGGTGTGNSLDDYEEGTYTPVVGAAGWNATSSNADGTYVKVGNIVTVHIRYASSGFSAVGMSDYLYVTLPFTAKSGGNTKGTLMCSEWSIGSSSISWIGADVRNNTSNALFHYHNGNNNNTNNLTKTSANNQLSFKGTVVYQTA